LGYDVDPWQSKLVVNPKEEVRVRAIFALYLKHQTLRLVVEELARRGWRNKRWLTRKGRRRGGQQFTKTSLYQLLTNVTYTGKLRYKDEVHPGEHAAIVEEAVWQQVQAVLRRNGLGLGLGRSRSGAWLQGLLRCRPCGCAMTPSYATKNGNRRY